jgi:hypothetical protein
MIDGQAILVLPLMHHFVKERLDCLAPPVTPNVAPADSDLRSLARRVAMSVVP